jgi:protein-S-isoprenylcysteine O-methyltransferase Ste14
VRSWLFREAVEAPPWRNLAKTAVQVVVLWSLALWIVPLAIDGALEAAAMTAFDITPRPAPGWAIFLAASATGLWSGAVMARRGAGTPLPLDHARRLVITGPYAHVRNPMAIAGLAQGFGVALMLGSLAVALYVAAGGLFWNVVLRPLEEARLTAQFGDAYRRYQREVPCWVIRRRPYAPADAAAPIQYRR